MPNYTKYQKSISDELIATKDRVRNFIDAAHWAEDGRYGIKGNAASWGDMCGGAEQLTMPLSGEQLERLGIMMEENSDDK